MHAGKYCLGLWICIAAAAQPPAKNPFTSPRDVEDGRRLYQFNCVNCHGMDGASGRGARLASTYRRYGGSDAEMFQTILNGVPGTEMPGLWLDETRVWKILAFVRTLEPAASTGLACRQDAGDAERGKAVFHGAGFCHMCHSVGSSGGRIGPDLSDAGQARTREQLMEAILHPDNSVSPRYRSIVLSARGGETIEGVLLAENDYSVHVIDKNDLIRSFRKEELVKIERPAKSMMPAYGGILNAHQMDDLLAFLCTLRGPAGARRP